MKNRLGNTLRTGLVALALGAGAIGLGGCEKFTSRFESPPEPRFNPEKIEDTSYSLNEQLNQIYENFKKEGIKPILETEDKTGRKIPKIYAFSTELNGRKIPTMLYLLSENSSNNLIRMQYMLGNWGTVYLYPNHPSNNGTDIDISLSNLPISCVYCGDSKYGDTKSKALAISRQIIKKTLQEQNQTNRTDIISDDDFMRIFGLLIQEDAPPKYEKEFEREIRERMKEILESQMK